MLSIKEKDKMGVTENSINCELFEGLIHVPVGSTRLSVYDSRLLVSNIGSGGEDGVSVNLGEGDIHIESDPLPDSPIGATIHIEFRGKINGLSYQKLAQTEHKRTPEGWQITPNFRAFGSTTCRLELFDKGKLVHSQAGMQGPVLTAPVDVALGCCYLHGKPECSYVFGFLATLQVNGGPSVEADLMILTPENPTQHYDFISEMLIRARDVSELSINGAWLMLSNIPHRALGRARFYANDRAVTMVNIGTTGDDGVEFDFLDFIYGKEVREFYVDVLAPEAQNNSLKSPTLTVGAIGSVEGVSNQKIGHIQLRKLENRTECNPDFSEISAHTHKVEIYDNDTLITSVEECTGKISIEGTVDSLKQEKMSIGVLSGQNGCEAIGYVFKWPCALSINFSTSKQYCGNELRILAEGSGKVDYLQSVRLQAKNTRSISILNESVSVASKEKLPLLS